MNLRKYIYKNVVVYLSVLSFLLVLISSYLTVYISGKYIASEESFSQLNQIYFAAPLFAAISLVLELLVLGYLLRLRLLNAEKIVAEACSSDNTKLPKTDITEFNLLLEKLRLESKGFVERFGEIGEDSEVIKGVFEIDRHTNKAIVSETLIKMLDIDKCEKDGNVCSFYAEDFSDIIKNIVKYGCSNEENLFLVDFDGKEIWLKAFLCKNEKYTIGFFTDETKRINNCAADGTIYENGSPNICSRDDFIQKVQKEMDENPDSVGCFTTIELDSLKAINNTYGHRVGDMYIEAAERVMANCAKSCIFGKKSGYEFMFYFYDYAPKSEIKEKLESRINTLKNEKFAAPDKKEYKFEITAGYCFFPDDGNRVEKLMRYSSYAIYEARTLHYGSVHGFSLETYNRAAYIGKKIERFHDIIENNLIKYVHQPIISLADGSVFGYEAFMRTNDDILKLPVEILEIAKSQNMLYVIEKMTAFNCLEIISKNMDLFKNKRLFCNTINSQILSRADFEMAVKIYGDVGHCLICEISVDDGGRDFYKKCASIKDNGDKIAIDNYAGKYVDFENLFAMNPDYVKIDRTIVRDINLKKDSQTFVSKFVKAAKERRITTMAVGIETYDELKTLVKLGVELAQGYYISMPMDEFVRSVDYDVVSQIEDINSYI